VVEAFIQGASSARSHNFVLMLFGYTILEWTIVIAAEYCFFHGYPETARLGVTEVLVFNGFIAFGSILQIPGIGGGMQVVAAVVLTQVFGLPIENATGLALLVWLLTFVSIVPVGIPLALHEGLTWRRIRDIEEKAGL
jgi:glycosyltransferase 2 family protein